MDVAIYKWINNAPNTPVSIGKSVDCNLQMTWDIGSRIAPVQAVIRFEKGALFLYAVEDGVKYLGKPLAINKGIRLFHGHRFVIGQTRFTYIEKDVKV